LSKKKNYSQAEKEEKMGKNSEVRVKKTSALKNCCNQRKKKITN
jgi:hypothetical protein